MAERRDSSLEYDTLLSNTDALTTGISIDFSSVAQKLVAKRLIPESSLREATEESKVVQQILKVVKLDPKNFEKFLSVIDDCPWLESLVKIIRTSYDQHQQDIKVRT